MLKLLKQLIRQVNKLKAVKFKKEEAKLSVLADGVKNLKKTLKTLPKCS